MNRRPARPAAFCAPVLTGVLLALLTAAWTPVSQLVRVIEHPAGSDRRAAVQVVLGLAGPASDNGAERRAPTHPTIERGLSGEAEAPSAPLFERRLLDEDFHVPTAACPPRLAVWVPAQALAPPEFARTPQPAPQAQLAALPAVPRGPPAA